MNQGRKSDTPRKYTVPAGQLEVDEDEEALLRSPTHNDDVMYASMVPQRREVLENLLSNYFILN